VRVSAKTDYALQAMSVLASAPDDEPIKAEQIATAQDIPLKFLLAIMNELKRARLVRSQRGADGGFVLARPAAEITLADVIRAIDGPLANIHDASVNEMAYPGPAEHLRDIWMAVRASLRSVLEVVTLQDLATGRLPKSVRAMAQSYETETQARYPVAH
jgi:Rrf2 family protein